MLRSKKIYVCKEEKKRNGERGKGKGGKKKKCNEGRVDEHNGRETGKPSKKKKKRRRGKEDERDREEREKRKQ